MGTDHRLLSTDHGLRGSERGSPCSRHPLAVRHPLENEAVRSFAPWRLCVLALSPLSVLCVLCASAVSEDGRLVTTPSYTTLSPHLAVPPFLEERLAYYNSFNSAEGKPEVNSVDAQRGTKITPSEVGVLGRGALTGKSGEIHLRSPAFSPHHPLSVLFWWALQEDARIDGAFRLFHLTNGRGFVSHFSRGKGEWCALERPAGVLQVYHFNGIRDVNGIYDYDLLKRLDLKAGVWHHTALTFSGGSVVNLYTDGAPTFKIHLKGRAFTEADAIHELLIGSRHGTPTCVDEVLILQRLLTADDIASYVEAVRQMRQARYPLDAPADR